MDQGHDGGMGDWAPNTFPGAWEQQFTDPALNFNPHAPQDHGYHHSHTPDSFTTAPSGQMNQHLPPPDPQRDLYNRPYQYYSEEAWSGPPSGAVPQAAHETSFGQPIPHGSQGYYHDQPQQQRQQSSDVHQTIDSRFALVDPPHGHEFQPQLHASHGQEPTDPYGFSTNMAQSQSSAANGYLQEAVPQWQQVAGHASEYAQNEEFDVPAPPLRNPSPLFPSGQGIAHPVQQQFAPAAEGQRQQQQQQGHLPAVQFQASAVTGSPRGMPHPVAQQAALPRPAAQQPATRAAPVPVTVPQPALVQNVPALQAMARQSPAVQQQPAVGQASASPGPAPGQVAPASVQVPPASVQAAAAVAQPAGVQAHSSGPPAAVGFAVDTQLIQEARNQEGATLPSFPHLVIGGSPVKLKKGPPTKRYVILWAKGGKPPMFPGWSRVWTLAELLGNHYEAYKAVESAEAADPNYQGNLDRYRADVRLKLELKISGHGEIPSDWWKKLQTTGPKKLDDEKVANDIEISEIIRLHSFVKTNPIAAKNAYELFYAAFSREVATLREWMATTNEMKRKWKAMAQPLETLLLYGLEEFDAATLEGLGRDRKVIAKLYNIVRTSNRIGETNNVLLKAILQLMTFNTKLTPRQLELLKFDAALKTKLEGRQDPKVRDLIAKIFANAEKNKHQDPPSPPAEMAGSVTKSDDKVDNKAAKAPVKAVNGKRGRDEDAHADDRSGKKQATGAAIKPAPGAAASKAPPAAAPRPAKSPAVAPAPTPVAGPVKRSNLLLPGKLRTPARPALKTEPPKAEPSKLAAKLNPTTKPQSAKPEFAKPQPAKPPGPEEMVSAAKASKPKVPEAPQPSRFAALLSEIDQPKKVKAADPPPVPLIDPNETEDERKRRLRKEERRKLNLRVAFRSEDRLVEIREFTRDPEEIAESAMARNIRSENKDKMEEGAALKKQKKELDEWEDRIAIDFNGLPAEKRTQTFVTRGGLKEFETEQQKFMQDREAKELMVVYTDVADIPPSPKSPQLQPLPYFPDEPIRLPDSPEHEEFRQRAKDREALGFRRATESAQKRKAEESRPGYAQYKKAMLSVDSIAGLYTGVPAPPPRAQTFDLVPAAPAPEDGPSQDDKDRKVLELLKSERVKNWKDPDPFDPHRPKTVRRYDYGDPKVQADVNSIEDLVARIKSGEAFQKPAPVEVAPAPALVAPAPQPTPASADHSAAWAQFYAQQQQVAATWGFNPQNGHGHASYMQAANPYGQATAQPTQPDSNNQVSALLAALQNPGNAGQQQQIPAAANNASLQTILAAVARSQPSGHQPAPVQASAPLPPQNNEYLRSLMHLTGQGQSNAGPAPPSYHDQSYHDQSGARQQHQAPYNNNSYGFSGSDRPSHQERDGGGGYDGRDQQRERDGDRRDRGFGHKFAKPPKGFQSDVPEHLRGINRNLIGTKQCTFFARGQCAKGDKCTFRHD